MHYLSKLTLDMFHGVTDSKTIALGRKKHHLPNIILLMYVLSQHLRFGLFNFLFDCFLSGIILNEIAKKPCSTTIQIMQSSCYHDHFKIVFKESFSM